VEALGQLTHSHVNDSENKGALATQRAFFSVPCSKNPKRRRGREASIATAQRSGKTSLGTQ
jgi:hypothetical protein